MKLHGFYYVAFITTKHKTKLFAKVKNQSYLILMSLRSVTGV